MVNYEKEFEEFIFHVIERSSENLDVNNSNNEIHIIYRQEICPKVHSISIKNEEYFRFFTMGNLLSIRIVLHRAVYTNEVITFETINPKMMRAFENYQKAFISAKKIASEKRDQEEVNLIRQSISNMMDK